MSEKELLDEIGNDYEELLFLKMYIINIKNIIRDTDKEDKDDLLSSFEEIEEIVKDIKWD
jgi:hypothetical protein